MTPRELLLGLWPLELADKTAGPGVDRVLKALNHAGYAITPKAQTAEAAAFLDALADRIELFEIKNPDEEADDCREMAQRLREPVAVQAEHPARKQDDA